MHRQAMLEEKRLPQVLQEMQLDPRPAMTIAAILLDALLAAENLYRVCQERLLGLLKYKTGSLSPL